jgi:phosphoserine phosphatase RsbU/P
MQAATLPDRQPPLIPGAGRVLIADDQEQVLVALEMLLHRYGFSTATVTHPASVLHALETEEFHAVLMDLNYTRDTIGGGEGLELVSQIRARDRLLPVMVMTAWSSVDLAVEAMRRGASDFVQKPWDNDELVQKLRDQLSQAEQRRRKQRLRAMEMQEARAIHDRALPKKLPSIAGYEVAAITQPLQLVGGDYYTVARINDRHTALCIADVAGKGLPAALLMSGLQAATRPLLEQNMVPRELCSRLNRVLCEVTPEDKFVSFFYALLDSEENCMTYCNAGHNPPRLIRSDGSSEELESTGAVLGQFPHWSFEQKHVQISSGDILLLFTDGLVDASNAAEEPFGERRLSRIACNNRIRRADNLMQLLLRSVTEYCEGHFQDDATLVVLKRDKSCQQRHLRA